MSEIIGNCLGRNFNKQKLETIEISINLTQLKFESTGI